MLIILVVPLALAMPPPNVTVTTTTERIAPPVNAFINNRHVSTQLIPTTSKRRILSLQGIPSSRETWPPPPPPPLEARPPTTAPTGPPIVRSSNDPDDIDTKIVKPEPRDLVAKKRRKKIKKLSKILKKNKKMLKKLLAVKHERDKERGKGNGRGKGKGKGMGKGKERGKGKGKGKGKGTGTGTGKEMLKETEMEMGRSRTHRPRASWGSSEDTEFENLVAQQKKKGQIKASKADKYDTMHAKGGKVSYLRLKGRLCQRSVLEVEGPKYNRAGGEYKPMYQDKKSYFSNTKTPHLLLPRCCNCCKKSVLGCE